MVPGEFCEQTRIALHEFQRQRGLRVSDDCSEAVWVSLVEATWALGDRRLVLTAPNMRGDDVAELQARLTRLGFDCGRVDGILGPATARALTEFQADCGLAADGVCGPDTIRMLDRVIGQTGSGPGVGVVREGLALRGAPDDLAALRVVVGQFGGLSALTRATARALRHHGAQVMTLDELDPVVQARAANDFEAHLYLGFEGATGTASIVQFYRVPAFESVGGRTLAEAMTREWRVHGMPVEDPEGVRRPVLRETRMPAVLGVLAPIRMVADQAPSLATAITRALQAWIRNWKLSG